MPSSPRRPTPSRDVQARPARARQLDPGRRPRPADRHKHGLIGTSVSRLDGPLKVQGAARFAAEFPLDGMVYAALAYATIPRGRIATLDTSAAEGAAGVVLVMTHLNAPRMNKPAVFGSSPTAAGPSDLSIMQDDTVHWNGQPIAVVLAETQEQADHAASLIAPLTLPRRRRRRSRRPRRPGLSRVSSWASRC